ncbi:MAG: VWA domain-containing protein [Verrucomicrobiota bacterium]
MLTFAHIWLFALAPLPLLIRWLVPPRAESQPAVLVPFLNRIRAAQDSASTLTKSHHFWPLLTLSLVWLLLVTALARPQWLEDPITREIPTRDLLLLVDLSGSMEAKDFTDSSGQPVDRLTAVKQVVGDFLSQREGDRVGLVVFGNAPFLQAPFTTDLELCRKLLDQTAVRMAGPKTAFGDAIGLGIRTFENSDAPAKTIIALTDGNDTGSGLPPVEAARVARDNGITIHTVAMGDPTTVGEEKLDEETLKRVAQETGGRYFLAQDTEGLVEIYDELDRIEERKVETVSHRPKTDLYFWPFAAAFIISLLSKFIPILRFTDKTTHSSPSTDARLRVNARTFELEVVD